MSGKLLPPPIWQQQLPSEHQQTPAGVTRLCLQAHDQTGGGPAIVAVVLKAWRPGVDYKGSPAGGQKGTKSSARPQAYLCGMAVQGGLITYSYIKFRDGFCLHAVDAPMAIGNRHCMPGLTLKGGNGDPYQSPREVECAYAGTHRPTPSRLSSCFGGKFESLQNPLVGLSVGMGHMHCAQCVQFERGIG